MSPTTQHIRSLQDGVIILIGYRGCGKTTVGRRLAERLGWEFVDTDEAVEATARRTIREIFEADGELTFRRIETQVLDRALAGRQRVISAGGGAVLARRNRKSLRSAGTCIWLTAPPEELRRRIAADERSAEQRPRLTSEPAWAEVERVLEARLPVYEATADHVVSTADRSIDEVVDAILEVLGAAGHPAERS
jgi:shikimate kinase